MARDRDNSQTSSDAVISIIGPGMTVVGDCESDGTIRIEGSVNGSVKAGKAVVIGKQGLVAGDIVNFVVASKSAIEKRVIRVDDSRHALIFVQHRLQKRVSFIEH